MDHRISRLNHHPLSQMNTQIKQANKTETSFQSHLQLEQKNGDFGALTVSKHASKRLAERNIAIDNSMWGKIANKVTEAKKLGVANAIVVTDQATLVINAKNKTVITAMNREEASTQIFTNINGTIII